MCQVTEQCFVIYNMLFNTHTFTAIIMNEYSSDGRWVEVYLLAYWYSDDCKNYCYYFKGYLECLKSKKYNI